MPRVNDDRKITLLIATLCLISFLVGWLLMGWLIWPVAYVGEAYTYELNQTDKLAYTSAVVDSFALTGQVNPAWFSGWYTDEAQQSLEQVARRNPAKANWARALANQVSVSVAKPVQVKAQNQAKDVLDPELVGAIGFRVIVIILAILVCGGVLLVWRRRDNALARERMHEQFRQDASQRFAARNSTDYIPVKPTPTRTLAHARLDFGQNHSIDQHFLIESQQEGEPSLGEFGVNQVEDFMAWDIWLFDQKALVTVTKVLADKTSEEISSRGEVVGWTDPIMLETPNLKMVGSVENSFVDELHHSKGIFTIELVVEAKDAE